MREENENRTGDKDVVFGKNAVLELLKSDADVDTLFLSDPGSCAHLAAMAREKGAVVKQLPAQKLKKLCGSDKHQGVAAFAALCDYCELDDIFDKAKEKNEPAFMVVADGIEDPHNLGAIIRSADCMGVHGVIIPKRGGCSVTAAVHRASAGALSHVLIARVSNLASAVREIKERGAFCYCAEAGGEDICRCDMTGPAVVVVGSEGFGVSRLLRDLCDRTVEIPLCGELNSLNASVAAGMFMYEIRRQRITAKR